MNTPTALIIPLLLALFAPVNVTDAKQPNVLLIITANQTGPFFCYLSYNAPHSPYQVPDNYFDEFKSRGFDLTGVIMDAVCVVISPCSNVPCGDCGE